MARQRKSTLYVRQADMKILHVNDTVYYICNKKSRNGSTFANSCYEYECDLCIHSVNSKGQKISELDDDSANMPHQLWCEFRECPFKDYYEEKKSKKFNRNSLSAFLDKFEKGEI